MKNSDIALIPLVRLTIDVGLARQMTLLPITLVSALLQRPVTTGITTTRMK